MGEKETKEETNKLLLRTMLNHLKILFRERERERERERKRE